MAKAAFVKGALRFRCALAFGRAESFFVIRLPRTYVLGYRYSAPSELARRHVRAWPVTTHLLQAIHSTTSHGLEGARLTGFSLHRVKPGCAAAAVQETIAG